MQRGFLLRCYEGVYAVGHRALGTEGKLAAALLRGGRGAALGAGTSLWWLGALAFEPKRLTLITIGRVRSSRGIRIIHTDRFESIDHRGLPTCAPARALIDFAANARELRVRRVLSEALFRQLVTVREIDAELRNGLNGSALMRRALERHRAGPVRTRSEKEEALLMIIEKARLPAPEVNGLLAGYEVDAVWRDLGLAVEVDGPRHAEESRVAADREREMAIRRAGFDLLRYSWVQVTKGRAAVVAELGREIDRRRQSTFVS